MFFGRGQTLWMLSGQRSVATILGGVFGDHRVFVAESGRNPPDVPFLVPQSESEDAEQDNVLVAPSFVRGGIYLWLTPIPGREILDFDEDTIEQLKALGYLGG